MKWLLLLLPVTAFAQTINYSHSNIYTTDAQFTADRIQCAQASQSPVTITETGFSGEIVAGNGTFYGGTTTTNITAPNCELFQNCLTARGYTQWGAGSLWASHLRCYNHSYRRFEVR